MVDMQGYNLLSWRQYALRAIMSNTQRHRHGLTCFITGFTAKTGHFGDHFGVPNSVVSTNTTYFDPEISQICLFLPFLIWPFWAIMPHFGPVRSGMTARRAFWPQIWLPFGPIWVISGTADRWSAPDHEIATPWASILGSNSWPKHSKMDPPEVHFGPIPDPTI